MVTRGSYANGLATRDEILDAGLHLIERDGVSGATVQAVADAAGVSKAGLLHHFATREQLLMEILLRRDDPKADQWFEAVRSQNAPDLVRLIADFLAANVRSRNVVEFSVLFTAQAAALAHPGHLRMQGQYVAIERELLPVVLHMHQEGRLADGLEPSDFITAALALMDGLQVRVLYEPELDVASVALRVLGSLVRIQA